MNRQTSLFIHFTIISLLYGFVDWMALQGHALKSIFSKMSELLLLFYNFHSSFSSAETLKTMPELCKLGFNKPKWLLQDSTWEDITLWIRKLNTRHLCLPVHHFPLPGISKLPRSYKTKHHSRELPARISLQLHLHNSTCQGWIHGLGLIPL